MLVLTLAFIIPNSNLFAPHALHKNFNRDYIIMQRVDEYHKQIYNQKISDYVLDIGVKYTYSSRAGDFLTPDYIDLVIKNSKSYPSVVIAMSILESGWGINAIGNNYFGIKGKGHWKTTREWDGNKFITIKAEFQKYNSLAKGIQAHSNLLHNDNYNIGVATDYKEAIKMIFAGGYATDPSYIFKLNHIIDKYELYRLDEAKDLFDKYLI